MVGLVFLIVFLGLAYVYLTVTQVIIVLGAVLLYQLSQPWLRMWFYKRQGVPNIPVSPLNIDVSWMINLEEQVTPHYPRYFTAVVGPYCFLNILDPKLMKEILVVKESHFKKDHPFIPLLRTIFGNGLIFSDGEVWKSERRVANKAFHHENLRKMAGLIEEACNAKLQAWKRLQNNGKSFETLWDDEMRELTLDVIGRCAFGNDYSSVEIEGERVKLTDYTKRLEQRVFDYGMSPLFFTCPKKLDLNLDAETRSLKRARNNLKSVGRQIIQNRVQELLKDPHSLDSKTDLLNLMIESHLDGKNIEECEDLVDLGLLVDECITFVFAGSETTSVLLTWAFYNLTCNPEIAQKLRTELENQFGSALKDDPTRIIKNYSDLDRLPLLHNVIQETLRLFPPAPSVSPRVAVSDIKVADLEIKKGTSINITPYLTHRSPFYWENPHKFDPYRTEYKKDDLRFMPFAAGKRSCIGRYFALMEAKIAITKFVLAMDIVCDTSCEKKLETKVTLSVKGGMKATITQK